MSFDLEFDFRKNEDALWLIVIAALLIAALVGTAQIGRGVTPADSAGSPRLLSWTDWRLLQAQRAYSKELSTLREDAVRLALMLEQKPNPVEAQILSETIARHAKNGDPSLVSARLALANAALNVRDWATGMLGRDQAIQSVQEAFALLR